MGGFSLASDFAANVAANIATFTTTATTASLSQAKEVKRESSIGAIFDTAYAVLSSMLRRHTAISGTASPAHTNQPFPVDAPICKPYLSISELATLTPWTDQAIRTMISRGTLKPGEHFFYVGRRPVFKWEAVVSFIERRSAPDRVPHYREQLNLWGGNEKSGIRPAPSK